MRAAPSPIPILDSALGKAALRLLPLIGLAYGLAYVDRVNISFAEPTMSRQLGFSATVYGAGAGLFFVSYAAAALPSNLLLMRFGPRRWLGGLMVAWGLLAAGMMFVRSPAALFAVRLALGAAEGGFFPGVILTLGMWFPAAWRGRSTSRFYIAAPLGTLVMGGLAGALLKLDGTFGLAGWQWLFLVEGLPSALLGLVLLIFLPDGPAQASWLNDVEQRVIGETLAADARATPPRPGGAITGPLADPRIWAMGVANFLILGLAYAITFSGPRLLQAGAHLSPGQSGWVVAASGLLGTGAMLVAAWSSDRMGERFCHLAVCWFIAAAGVAMMAFIPSGWPLVAGYLLFFLGHFGAQVVFWAAIDRLVAPSQAAAGIALISTVGMVGSFLGPVVWGAARDLSGSYELGLRLIPFGIVAAGLIALLLRRAVRPAISSAIPESGVAEEI